MSNLKVLQDLVMDTKDVPVMYAVYLPAGLENTDSWDGSKERWYSKGVGTTKKLSGKMCYSRKSYAEKARDSINSHFVSWIGKKPEGYPARVVEIALVPMEELGE